MLLVYQMEELVYLVDSETIARALDILGHLQMYFQSVNFPVSLMIFKLGHTSSVQGG